MGGDILVAKVEPIGSAEALDVGHRLPGFAGAAPARIGICQSRQRVADRVEVGRDGQPQMFKVIARVDDDGQVFGRQNLGESVREFRATDSSCKGNNFHGSEKVDRARL